MKSLEQAFLEQASTLQSAELAVKSILEDFCRRHGFLLVGRAKSMDSLRDKLETGRYPNLASVDDMIAFSVVIDTIAQEDEVRAFIGRAFSVIAVKSGVTLQDERIFDFDCTRIYCTLEDKLNSGSPLFQVPVEIQIRTILQHAWAKITHPHVYKANSFDARAARLAAELMAQLESVDRCLSAFNANSRGVKTVNRREMLISTAATQMIDQLVQEGVVPREMRPTNGRRFGDNVYSSIQEQMRRHYKKPLETIRKFYLDQRDNFPRSVTLLQLAIVALHEAGQLEHGSARRPRRYYITDELISLFPSAKEIPNRIVID